MAPGPSTFVMAHGAGLGSDSPWMLAMSGALEKRGVKVVRFDFEYMELARKLGKKRPPPKLETLLDEYRVAIKGLSPKSLFIGGKSMGGRVASHLATESPFAGLILLGYPFHPPGKPEKLRTEHLARVKCRTLICQGERDPFGNREEIEALKLRGKLDWCWLCQGNHDFKPPKSAPGTLEQNVETAATAAWKFMNQ